MGERPRSRRLAAPRIGAGARPVRAADHQHPGEHVVQGLPAPVEQRKQQDQLAGHRDRDIEQRGMRQRLQKHRTLAVPGMQLEIEGAHPEGRHVPAADQQRVIE